ncbi:hypothetical protein ACJMK2_034475 [Sinanodonta woodiana]|uniref:NADPH:adrenodoxin oxidoreductase, mitochondrial n=1 Tax=Sinanodonta woodiana TaxID=1069815 RepID=A0ABD3WVU7_SINWO
MNLSPQNWLRMQHYPHFLRKVLRQLGNKSQSRSSSTHKDGNPHICIVGSGPAGFYTAQQLLKGHPSLRVDIFERLPVPFGLVRYGVAPDHPEVKNVINTFTQTANNDRCSFLGNVQVGKDITVTELLKIYSAVVLAYGAAADKLLGIPGENLPNILPARTFVGWYNGLPEDKDLKVNLDTETAVIVGHGNVALDVARILLTPVDILAKTDISDYALEALRKSSLKRVVLVGRRGPLQVAFTIKELREMIKLPECRPVFHKEDFKDLEKIFPDLPRPRKRLTELMHKTCFGPTADDVKLWNEAKKEWELKFRLTPMEVLSSAGQLTGLRCAVNKLEGSNFENQKAVSTDEHIDLPCGLIFRSIGYRSLQIDPAIPFDKKQGVIPNEKGRVTGVPGLYCSGWVGRGPVGVILSTMTDGFDVGKVILKDLAEDHIPNLGRPGFQGAMKILEERGVKMVSFSDWKKIDEHEVQMGEKFGKPREKIADVQNMIKILTHEK